MDEAMSVGSILVVVLNKTGPIKLEKQDFDVVDGKDFTLTLTSVDDEEGSLILGMEEIQNDDKPAIIVP